MPRSPTIWPCLIALAAASLVSDAPAQPFVAHWESPFTVSQPNSSIGLLRFFTDHPSEEPRLFAAGSFTDFVNTEARRVAFWDGRQWSPMGQGLDGSVATAFEFDDASGPALYIAGDFTLVGSGVRGVARWRNNAWEGVGAPSINGSPVVRFTSLVAHDDGGRPRLFGAALNQSNFARVLRWDGAAWSDISGPILTGPVNSLAAVDEGPLRGLYAGGNFFNLGGAPITRVARWDGASWGGLGPGQPFMTNALHVAHFHAAPEVSGLYVLATISGSPNVTHLHRWDGATWHEAPPELPREPMRVLERGGVERMYFIDDEGVLSWNGVAIAREGPTQADVWTFDFDDGVGGAGTMHIGGSFAPSTPWDAPWDAPKRVAREENDAWVRLDNGLPSPLDCLTAIDLGDGETLVAAMRQENDDVIIVCLDDGKWTTHSVLPEAASLARRIVRFDRGGIPGQATLYSAIGGVSPHNRASSVWRGLARWDGAAWWSVGDGLTYIALNTGAVTPAWVSSAVVFDDGQGGGEQLYVAGDFTMADGVPAQKVARWNGAAWSAVGTGLLGLVYDLRVFDDGAGPRLYAAGSLAFFASVARWNGVAWEFLPPPGGLSGQGYALGEQTIDGEPRLIAAGSFGVARWDGAAWEVLRPVQSSVVGGPIVLLASLPTPHGTALAAMANMGVRFFNASPLNPAPARPVALHIDERWQLPDTGLRLPSVPLPWMPTLSALVPFDDGTGPALWIAGDFSRVNYTGGSSGEPASNIATLRVASSTCAADITFDGVVNMADLNALLSGYGAAQAIATGPLIPADCNFSGRADFLDLNLVLSAFGAACD